jgi:hypothetical protein
MHQQRVNSAIVMVMATLIAVVAPKALAQPYPNKPVRS